MQTNPPSRAVINQLYLSLVLLHADSGLLGIVGLRLARRSCCCPADRKKCHICGRI
jgi:hypothetical protein